jgi:hypothetical protein
MKLVRIVKSRKKDKKFDAVFQTDGKERIVSFGAAGYSDFTIHKDPERMKRYQARHKNDNIKDPMSPGALSWYILWTSPTFEGGVANYRKQFKL